MAKSEKIIISVELTDKGLKASSSKAKKAIDGITESTSKLDKATQDLKFQQTDEAKKLAEMQLKAQLATKANKDLAIATLAAADATKKGRTQTGLNNAILTEAGRTASDAAYGMMGMANNIGQMVTLMNQHAQTKGGFIASFKELGTSLMGSGGILIGLQLLISFAPKIEKMFSAGSSEVFKFRKELAKLKNEVYANQTVANDYLDVLEDVNSSEKDRKIAIQEVLDIVPSLREEDLQYGKNLDDVRKEVNKYIQSQVARIEIDKLVQENSEILGRKMRMDSIRNIEDAQERTKAMNEFLKEEGEGTIEISNTLATVIKTGIGMGASGVKFREKTGKELTAVWDKMAGLVDKKAPKILKRIDYLRKSLMLEPDEKKNGGDGNGSKMIDQFKQNLLNLEKELLKSEDKYKATRRRDEIQIIKDAGDTSKELINIKRDGFIQEEQLRLDVFIAKQTARMDEDNADTEALQFSIDKAKAYSAEAITIAEVEAEEVINSINSVTEARIANQIKLDEFKALKRSSKEEESSDATTVDMMPEGMAKIDAEKALSDLRYSNKVAAAEAELALLTTTGDRRKQILSNMTIWEDERRSVELENEIDVIREKQRVNEQYISFVSGISGLLSAVAGENKELQAAALVFEKGAAIADIIVKTTASNQVARAEGVALSIPTSGASVVAAEALAAKNNISAGISIATILATTIGQSKGMKSQGGGGGGGQTVQPPDFNIIGSTGTNQLAEAIGTTTKLPIKAYVVSSDVTSAQEMDRNIVESSSIG